MSVLNGSIAKVKTLKSSLLLPLETIRRNFEIKSNEIKKAFVIEERLGL